MRTACHLRLKPDSRASNEINRHIDAIAPDMKTAVAVIGTCKPVAKGGERRMYPVARRLVERDVLEKRGARAQSGAGEASLQK